jgi:hypothetical protein
VGWGEAELTGCTQEGFSGPFALARLWETNLTDRTGPRISCIPSLALLWGGDAEGGMKLAGKETCRVRSLALLCRVDAREEMELAGEDGGIVRSLALLWGADGPGLWSVLGIACASTAAGVAEAARERLLAANTIGLTS